MEELDRTSGPAAGRHPAALTVFKTAGVVVASSLLCSLLVRLVGAIDAAASAWLVLPAFVLGYACADLLSGTAHWFCDTFFEEDTPLIGKILIQPFRDHHERPERIVGYRFLEQDTTNFFIMLPALALAGAWGAPRPGDVEALVWCCGLAGLSTGLFCTNLFHKWAHARRPPVAARWLQRSGLILGPARHSRHHGDHRRGFCVTSGWLNPVLDAVRFFPRVEGVVRFFRR